MAKETTTQRRARLKAMRKKYGLGEFSKNSKKNKYKKSASKKTNKKVSSTMVKRRKTTTRRKSSIMGNLSKPLMSGVVYAFIQPIVSQMLAKFNIGLQDEVAQILAAVVLKNMTRSSIINNYANAAIIVNTAALVNSYAGNITGNLFSTQSASGTSSNGYVLA